ncbi:hypothetical protein [Lacrimispora indolis]|uniref:hypothetical protein n=1 Tax=Lacrimispora indolis TaxID=69825 RepID=UPI001FA6FC1D|nr:hypothetical protein [[Clostridium] methoxybenzovorans]
MSGAHIIGEHLLLPGYGQEHPTLGIFSYDELKEFLPAEINRPGIAHLAFEAGYPNNVEAVFVYARDPEGNILELQGWRKVKN